jgi:non-ribosomal peptide synthase protein (TIGR01720 family)
MAGGADLGRAVKRIKEQLRALPDHGLGYGLLRYLNRKTGHILEGMSVPQIRFNYLGRFSAPASEDWGPAPEGFGNWADERMPLSYSIDLNAITQDRPAGPELIAHWTWAGHLFSEA